MWRTLDSLLHPTLRLRIPQPLGGSSYPDGTMDADTGARRGPLARSRPCYRALSRARTGTHMLSLGTRPAFLHETLPPLAPAALRARKAPEEC